MYHENGKIAGKGFFKGGLEHGLFEWFNEDGTLEEIEKWNLGKIIDDGDE